MYLINVNVINLICSVVIGKNKIYVNILKWVNCKIYLVILSKMLFVSLVMVVKFCDLYVKDFCRFFKDSFIVFVDFVNILF